MNYALDMLLGAAWPSSRYLALTRPALDPTA